MKKQFIGTLTSMSLLATLSCLPGVAYAVDGVILIDQFRALVGNVTPGDAPGFPVDINRPGSYRLAGNLTVFDPNKTAIRINTTNVTLDLNGFTIRGPTVCEFDANGENFQCRNTGTGRGVEISPGAQQSAGGGEVAVSNGMVQGMGADGVWIHLIGGGVVRNITSIRNGRAGVTGFATLIEGVRANYNGEVGIEINAGTLRNSIAEGNGGDGIFAMNTMVVGNFSRANEGYGLSGQGEVSIAQNTFQVNGLGHIAPMLVPPIQIGSNACGAALCP